MGVSVCLCLRMSKWVYVRVVLHVCFARVLYTVMVAFAPGIKPWRWKWRWREKKKKRKWECELKVNNAENKLSISFNLLAARFSQRHRYKTNICKVITKASANALSLYLHPPSPFLSHFVIGDMHKDRGRWQNEPTTGRHNCAHTYKHIRVYIYMHMCVCVSASVHMYKQSPYGLLLLLCCHFQTNRWDWLWLPNSIRSSIMYIRGFRI